MELLKKKQELDTVDPWGDASLRADPALVCWESVSTLLSKTTPVPLAVSQIHWNFMSFLDILFVRRPNLRQPLRLIANFQKKKNADIVETKEFFLPLPWCPLPCIC